VVAVKDIEPRAVIAEDEAVLREELHAQVTALWPDLSICASVADGHAALAALEAHRPHVLFLDIQMPGLSGIEVARHASGRCHVAFVTAHDEFAVTAFEQGAIDYVMKPFSTERLALTVGRLQARLTTQPANLEGLLESLTRQLAPPPVVPPLDQRVAGQRSATDHGGRGVLLQVRYEVHPRRHGAQESLIRKSVRELIVELDPSIFRQVHRSIIVNLAEVAGVQRDFRGRIHLRLKHRPETLPVSEPYAPLFRQM
jgi:DNA-binding LytR/AlgR family response regulator